MTKTEAIFLRVDLDTKRRIAQAARRSGLSMTDFILQSANRAAGRVRSLEPDPLDFDGDVPRFFRLACQRAQQGGHHSYEVAGREFLRHLSRLVGLYAPADAPEAAREAEFARLARVLRRRSEKPDPAVLSWFLEHYPSLMALVPRRRHDQFLDGVYECVRSGEACLLGEGI